MVYYGSVSITHFCVCRILDLIYLSLSFALIYFFLCVCVLDFRMVPSHAHFHLGLRIIGWHILARFFDTLFNYSSYELWQYIVSIAVVAVCESEATHNSRSNH